MNTMQNSIVKRERISIAEGKTVRIRVRTTHATYTGDLFISAKRNRFSDVMNEPNVDFISLTEVRVNETQDKIKHLVLNKSLIESVRLDE